jgi:hypothetical protein
LLLPSPACADSHHGIEAFTGLSWTSQRNFLRTPDAVNAAEQISHYFVSVAAKPRWQQQQFVLRADANKTNYAQYDAINTNGYNLLAQWNWKLGARMRGDMGYGYTAEQGSLEDIQLPVKNTQIQKRLFYSFIYEAPAWVASWGVGRGATEHIYAGETFKDHTSMNYFVDMAYVSHAGNRLGIKWNRYTSKPDGAQLFLSSDFFPSLLSLDRHYTEQNMAAYVRWAGAPWQLSFDIGGLQRHYQQDNGRNVRGLHFNSQVNYEYSPKTQWNIQLIHAISGKDELLNAQSVNATLRSEFTWKPTVKQTYKPFVQINRETFSGATRLVYDNFLGESRVYLGSADRVDRNFSTGLIAEYTPTERWFLHASLLYQSRRSSMPQFSYKDTLFLLGARWQFY